MATVSLSFVSLHNPGHVRLWMPSTGWPIRHHLEGGVGVGVEEGGLGGTWLTSVIHCGRLPLHPHPPTTPLLTPGQTSGWVGHGSKKFWLSDQDRSLAFLSSHQHKRRPPKPKTFQQLPSLPGTKGAAKKTWFFGNFRFQSRHIPETFVYLPSHFWYAEVWTFGGGPLFQKVKTGSFGEGSLFPKVKIGGFWPGPLFPKEKVTRR